MGFLILVIVLSAIAVLRSRAFHRYVLAKMVEAASQATGARVEIGDFQFRWSGLRIGSQSSGPSWYRSRLKRPAFAG